MPWNEPGGNPRDPWGGGSRGPDLEGTLRRLRERFGRFGGGGGGLLSILLAVVLALVLVDSFTVINARQVGVVLRFGRFERVLPPGFHLKFPHPIEAVTKVETTQVKSVTDQVRMITNDENIVLVDFNVQFQIADARKYLFSMRDPEDTLRQAAEASVRSVVGANTMDTILSAQGAELVSKTRDALQKILDGYDCGITVTEVNFQNVSPPQEVKAAFDDVNNAREDKQRIENEAQAYASKVVPEARGEAARITADAQGYKAERVAAAEGESSRFEQILLQYRAAPDVTKRRLWLETVEKVLAGTPKVIDGSRGKNLIYLQPDGAAAPARALPGAVAGAASANDAGATGDKP